MCFTSEVNDKQLNKTLQSIDASLKRIADSVGQDQSRPMIIELSDEAVAKAALKTMRDIERES